MPIPQERRATKQQQRSRDQHGSEHPDSNKSYGDWGSIFGDPIIATAVLDRLLHHSTTINIRGESYRL
jgi:DNA replication protein DnaC